MSDLNNTSNNINGTLAPIAVFVYKRMEHTANLLTSLAGCVHAKETEVFIFSDGPKKETDVADVSAVRNLIHDSKWEDLFGKITVIEAPSNKGLANSIISGATQIINEYGKVLVLEDDLIVAPYYITYMNQALNAFENSDNIFAVAGWSYPVKELENYKKDAWLHYRPCSWGWGTWKDRWDKVVWDPEEAHFMDKLSDRNWLGRLDKAGTDLAPMLRRQLNGEIDSWAVRWTANQVELGMLAVFPTHPVVFDDGRDGTGTHAHARQGNDAVDNNRKLEQFISSTFVYGKEVFDFSDAQLDKKIVRAAWNYDSDTLVKKIKRNLKKIFVEHNIPDFMKIRK